MLDAILMLLMFHVLCWTMKRCIPGWPFLVSDTRPLNNGKGYGWPIWGTAIDDDANHPYHVCLMFDVWCFHVINRCFDLSCLMLMFGALPLMFCVFFMFYANVKSSTGWRLLGSKLALQLFDAVFCDVCCWCLMLKFDVDVRWCKFMFSVSFLFGV